MTGDASDGRTRACEALFGVIRPVDLILSMQYTFSQLLSDRSNSGCMWGSACRVGGVFYNCLSCVRIYIGSLGRILHGLSLQLMPLFHATRGGRYRRVTGRSIDRLRGVGAVSEVLEYAVWIYSWRFALDGIRGCVLIGSGVCITRSLQAA